MSRRSESGQVGVETALVMPLTVFLILGIMQLSMMQQARLLTEYAAFRAVRAGAIDQINCKKMNAAALEAILPSFGKADDATSLVKTYTVPSARLSWPMMNQTGVPGFNIIDISYVVQQPNSAPAAPYTAQDFDDPDHPQTLVDLVVYNYELNIPFADSMIYHIWTGTEFVSGNFDVLMPATNGQKNLRDLGTMSDRVTTFNGDPNDRHNEKTKAAAAAILGRYFVPIRSSYTMRMMSNLPSGVTANSVQDCSSSAQLP
ncbi:MAG TPA: TadE/TadG family type IV pilus assembly protein [Myxococcales bacterium]|nr:TadE/TadG family type IV pilus assembly protein [Myxococcales bacterium]